MFVLENYHEVPSALNLCILHLPASKESLPAVQEAVASKVGLSGWPLRALTAKEGVAGVCPLELCAATAGRHAVC